MVDVTVDATPKEQLPYDPKDIPEAVKKRVAAVEALYKQTPEPAPTAAPEAQVSTSPEPAPRPPTQPAPDASSPASTPSSDESDDNSNTWKSRALSKEGRIERLEKDLGELQQQYFEEVSKKPQSTSQPERRRDAPSKPPRQYLT